MSSVLSGFSTQAARVPPRAFGRKKGRSLSTAVRLAFVRTYRALVEARMRQIRMELALHGVRYDRNTERQAPTNEG